ncbi:unnamed protein product [Polarella glacialis]|uniref:JmjC domain-containing protein n=1 Tax=Polarella glacialis TaxID=89957 RepID=A0A813GPI4_POLGL|nr:unnamed protein product [Polarella glacialis]
MNSQLFAAAAAAVALGFKLEQASASIQSPVGHLEPFGGWLPGEPIEERQDVPGPEDFYTKYSNADNGNGRPVVFRGAALRMPAMKWRSDKYLLERFGNEDISGVEWNLKETRAGGNVEGMNKMRDFLASYNTSDIYMVSQVPKGMQDDVQFLPCMQCGGYLKFLDVHNMWIGRGGSKSVVHYDDQDNINCMLDGEKRFIFMHPSYKNRFEAHPNSPRNQFGWVDTALDRSIPGYGAFMGDIDVDRMDLIKYPGWRDVKWSYVDLKPGDCVYIPYQWYHQVTARPGRSINVHIWYWRPKRFDSKSCQADPSLSPLPHAAATKVLEA